MLGISAVVLCGCAVVASVIGILAVVFCGCDVAAGSVGSDTRSLLLSSVGLAVGCS